MIVDNIRNNAKDIQKTFSSPVGRKLLIGVGLIIFAFLIFHAGVEIGSHRHFRGVREEGYGFRAVPGMKPVSMPDGGGFIQGGHGTVGVVESIDNGVLSVRMRNGSTQTVIIDGKTMVRSISGNASTSDINTGSEIVVLGVPDDAHDSISADLIRILPARSATRSQ